MYVCVYRYSAPEVTHIVPNWGGEKRFSPDLDKIGGGLWIRHNLAGLYLYLTYVARGCVNGSGSCSNQLATRYGQLHPGLSDVGHIGVMIINDRGGFIHAHRHGAVSRHDHPDGDSVIVVAHLSPFCQAGSR